MAILVAYLDNQRTKLVAGGSSCVFGTSASPKKLRFLSRSWKAKRPFSDATK
jgi:hypothetical protein